MESFFSHPIEDRNGITHVFLMQGSFDELLQICDWDDLCRFLQQVDVAWFSRETYVFGRRLMNDIPTRSPLVNDEDVHHTHHITLETNDDPGQHVCLASVTAVEPTQVYTQLFQLLDKYLYCHRVSIRTGYHREQLEDEFSDFSVSVETLSSLQDIFAGRNDLEFDFKSFFFSDEHCRKLASFQQKLFFNTCSFADAGRSFFEASRNNRGPTELGIWYTSVDTQSLCNSLVNSSHLKILAVCAVPGFFPQCLSVLERIRGLTELYVDPDASDVATDQEWNDMFGALRKQETLETFTFACMSHRFSGLDTDAARAARAEVILETMRHNEVLSTIGLVPKDNLVDPQFFAERIQPYLTANLYRPRFKALEDETDLRLQRQLFGRALTHTEVNQNPRVMFQLLSGNHEILSELYRETETQDEDMALITDTSSGKKRTWSQLNA